MFKNLIPSVPKDNDLVEMDHCYMLHSTELSCIMYQNGWLLIGDRIGIIEKIYVGKFMFYYELKDKVRELYGEDVA